MGLCDFEWIVYVQERKKYETIPSNREILIFVFCRLNPHFCWSIRFLLATYPEMKQV